MCVWGGGGGGYIVEYESVRKRVVRFGHIMYLRITVK